MTVVDEEKSANSLQLFYNNNEPNDFTQTKANLARYHVDSRLSRQPPRLFYLVAELGSTPTDELSSRFSRALCSPALMQGHDEVLLATQNSQNSKNQFPHAAENLTNPIEDRFECATAVIESSAATF